MTATPSSPPAAASACIASASISQPCSPVSVSASRRSTTVFGSSASCTTISASSISNRKPCNPSTTPAAQGCHPCLRYVPLPMYPVRTVLSALAPAGGYPSSWGTLLLVLGG